MPAVKICGLTTAHDARAASTLGASYGGVIFAGGPRCLSYGDASVVLGGLSEEVKRVGVFGVQPIDEIAAVASQLRLAVVQLHEHRGADAIARLRTAFNGVVWSVARADEHLEPGLVAERFAEADGVVMDGGRRGTAGGLGISFDWAAVVSLVEESRLGKQLVLAGGLRPENVSEGVRIMNPDVVDVSSGVESAVGVKDLAKMEAFVHAVRDARR